MAKSACAIVLTDLRVREGRVLHERTTEYATQTVRTDATSIADGHVQRPARWDHRALHFRVDGSDVRRDVTRGAPTADEWKSSTEAASAHQSMMRAVQRTVGEDTGDVERGESLTRRMPGASVRPSMSLCGTTATNAEAIAPSCAPLDGQPVGDAYDNAMAESFVASLEFELVDSRAHRQGCETQPVTVRERAVNSSLSAPQALAKCLIYGGNLVGVRGFEPPASTSRT